MQYIIGMDIGGTKCGVILARHGENLPVIVDKRSFQTKGENGVDQTLKTLMALVDDILTTNRLTAKQIAHIGISCGGPLDSQKGIIMSPPNLPGWDNIPITRLMQEAFGIPTSLQNDANAGALAEWKFGAAKGCQHVIFLTFGTGMGAGLILNGKLYSGTNDMAGEVGHIRLSGYGPVGYGKAGSFEGFCSGGGIAQLAQTMVLEKLQSGERVSFCPDILGLAALDAKLVAQAAAAGDTLAAEIFRVSGEQLGRGLAFLMDILNPQVIVIGSIFERCTELLWPSAQAVIQQEALLHTRSSCQVVPAALGDQIGDFAALGVAINAIQG